MAVRAALFPCIGCLGDRARRNHVQQVLPLTLHSRTGLVGRQAGVDVRHGHPCEETEERSVNQQFLPRALYVLPLNNGKKASSSLGGADVRFTCVAAALLPPGGHAALAADL